MQGAQARMLPDGRRLHLHHGPIDLIIEVFGPGRHAAHAQAMRRFGPLLEILVEELPVLRQPISPDTRFTGPVATRMGVATRPFAADFITPMAAVAGAVAEEILAALIAPGIRKAYVNNGGDIALYLTPGETFTTALAHTAAAATITADMGIGGIATSGWQGRSHSLGIADAVTVLAADAATADAAATLIANAIDLPGHPRIQRQPANHLSPDSDLGDRRVTTAVPLLNAAERARALDCGLGRAQTYLARGLITAAHLSLQGATRATAGFKERIDA